eukprot:gene20913-27759_t
MDLGQVLQTVESACRDFNAEAVLLQFRSSLSPIAACRHILEHGSVDAKFYAACTLREAVIREWTTMGAEEVRNLRSYMLQYALYYAADAGSNIVRSTLVAAIALMLKRGWRGEEEAVRAAFFQDMQAAISANGTAPAQRTGMELLESIVTEFSLTTASPLGLAWDYHDNCARELEEQYLQGFFAHAVSPLPMLTPFHVTPPPVDRIPPRPVGTAASGEDAGPILGPTEHQQLTPDQTWSGLLLSRDTSSWLIDLCAALGGCNSSTLAVQARHLVVAFCSLSGNVFPKGEQAADLQTAAQEWAIAAMGPSATLLSVMDALTRALVAGGGVGDCDDEPWIHDCTDMVLDAWASLTKFNVGAYFTGSIRSQTDSTLSTCGAHVFLFVAQAALQDVVAGVHEDAVDADEAAEAASLEDWMARSGDPSEPLEQLCWLVRMSAHCLADCGVGETPMLPVALMDACEREGATSGAAIATLCKALLELPALVLQDAARPCMSPRLMETCVWSLARWADTYLYPDEALPDVLLAMYAGQAGQSVLDMIVQVANTCLVQFPGEAELHSQGYCGEAYVNNLLGPAANEVSSLASRPDLSSISGLAPIGVQVVCLLETFRGATRASLSVSQGPMFSVVKPLLPHLLTLSNAFKRQAAVSAVLLKLAADVVEAHVSFIHLLRQYAANNPWNVTNANNKTLQAGDEADRVRELRALLKLLTHVTQRDVADLDSTSSTPQTQAQHKAEVAEVVLLGLNVVVPLMSASLLQFPKLCRSYFSLLAYVLEMHTEQVAGLHAAPFSMIMQSLDFGIMSNDTVVAQSALEGLAGIGRYHYQSQQAGCPGFGGHQVSAGKGVATHFMELLLRRLLFEDTPTELVELAADALLALILSDPATYQAMTTAVASSIKDSSASIRAVTALGSVLPPAGAHMDLSRQTRWNFRNEFCAVVATVRGLVRMR